MDGYPTWLRRLHFAMEAMALIEIDALPNLKMHGGSFHGKLLVITRW